MEEQEEVPSKEVKASDYDEEAELEEMRKESTNVNYNKIPAIGGDALILTVDRYVKDENKFIAGDKQEFKQKGKEGDGYCRVLYDTEDKELVVSTYALDSKLRAIFLEQEKVRGLKLSIARPKHGEYVVELIGE